MDPLSLTPELLSSFKVTKSFDSNRAPLSSLSFDDTGDFCVTSAQDDSVNVYDCREGRLRTTLFSRRYGVGLTRFTHQSSSIVYGSTKEDGTLRYLSLHDNKYIRYFTGHKSRVISLEMSPLDDHLISSSLDGTVRLWDLRSPICEGMINSTGRPIAAIDNAGLVFGVGLDSEVLRLYDIRSFDTGPFATWTVPESDVRKGTYYWTSIKFTNDSQHILITTSIGIHYVVHAFEGHIVKRLMGPIGTPLSLDPQGNGGAMYHQCGEEISVSPDARYVFNGGTQDGVVRVWDLLDNSNDSNHMNGTQQQPATLSYPIAELSSGRPGPVNGINMLGFNPSLMMMVSGGKELDFWEPSDIRH